MSTCTCARCAPQGQPSTVRVCPDCGNKRCPKGTNHDLACTGSNNAGQAGSQYLGFTEALGRPALVDMYEDCALDRWGDEGAGYDWDKFASLVQEAARACVLHGASNRPTVTPTPIPTSRSGLTLTVTYDRAGQRDWPVDDITAAARALANVWPTATMSGEWRDEPGAIGSQTPGDAHTSRPVFIHVDEAWDLSQQPSTDGRADDDE